MSAPGNPGTYRICTRCIMDTSDAENTFDERGVCIRCREYETGRAIYVPRAGAKDAVRRKLIERISEDGRRREYDCVIGVSGGVDSTYTAYLAKSWGLRPLAVHLDNGWNSNLAVSNIEKCLKTLSIDLYTHVLDWDEFKDLQLAFLRASTPDSEIPTDHAILALLMKKAASLRIRYILSGSNIATEGLGAPSWSRGHWDWKYIKSVHREFGTVPLRTFPRFTLAQMFYYRHVLGQRSIDILNYVDYRKETAMDINQRELGWQPYAGKHHESIYTRFFQSYILPRKFGFDKRRAHLSALIMAGEITREQALRKMEEEICPPELLREDKVYIAKKLGLTEEAFDRIMALPPKTFWDYPSYERTPMLRAVVGAYRKLVRQREVRRRNTVREAVREPRAAGPDRVAGA
jgi:N-acetyl sugar amidotransferase